jgi:uncharacterized membrane protein YfcA
VSIAQHLLAILVVLVGSAIQGAVGFGVNLFAAPLLVLIDPGLVPGPAIVASSVLNLLVIRREPAPHVWRQMRWPITGQVPGTFAGAAVLALVARANLTVFFSLTILLAVGLSLSGLHPRRTTRTLTAAGFLSGFMGTAGPPIALMYQKATGPELRAALSRFFGIGGLLSLTMLTLFGQFSWQDLFNGMLLIPGAIAGYALSSRLLHHVDAGRVRLAVLSLSAASAVVALVRALV